MTVHSGRSSKPAAGPEEAGVHQKTEVIFNVNETDADGSGALSAAEEEETPAFVLHQEINDNDTDSDGNGALSAAEEAETPEFLLDHDIVIMYDDDE